MSPSWYTMADEAALRAETEAPGLNLDPRWEWHLVQRLGMPDEYIKGRCLHTEVVPVESVEGERVAQLCRICDTQLPA